ncbi:hypothetical protein ACFSNO_13500 [Streptomyces cirratus]
MPVSVDGAVPAAAPGAGGDPGWRERPDPVTVIPWGMRVAAEASWRLLLLAGMLWY